jgi:WD40 repeat protein
MYFTTKVRSIFYFKPSCLLKLHTSFGYGIVNFTLPYFKFLGTMAGEACDSVGAAVWLPRSGYLVSGGDDGYIRIWHVEAAPFLPMEPFTASHRMPGNRRHTPFDWASWRLTPSGQPTIPHQFPRSPPWQVKEIDVRSGPITSLSVSEDECTLSVGTAAGAHLFVAFGGWSDLRSHGYLIGPGPEHTINQHDGI